MTPNEQGLCRGDLFTFAQTLFSARHATPFKENPHQRIICNALERVMLGDCQNLIINVPPRSGKTELAVVNFIAWAMGIYPDGEFIHASYSKRLASQNTFNVRSLMQSEEYRAIFPWVKLRDDSRAKDEFRTIAEGVVYASGAEGTITGYGAGKMRDSFGGAIVIDDPHKAGEANSPIMRENVLNWYQTTIESRKNTPDTPVIVIMQRLHELDLVGWLLDGGDGNEWEHIVIPAIKDDVSFWPEQFPLDDLRRKEKANAYIFAGQYMQRPAPIGGGIFRDEWWEFYTEPPAITTRAIYADTAQKTKEQNDYSVFQCWGKSQHGQTVLLDQVRGKWEAPELRLQAGAFWLKHNAIKGMGHLRAFKVEDKVSGTGLIQELKREGIPMIAIQRNIDKVLRAHDAAPFIESGNVLLPREASWLSDFLAEHSAFPNGANDDQVDPMMDAVTDTLSAKASPRIRTL